MKFCLGSRCRMEDGSPRRRFAAIVPLIATLPSTIMLLSLTRHHHSKETSSSIWGLFAGVTVGLLLVVGIITLKKAKRNW